MEGGWGYITYIYFIAVRPAVWCVNNEWRQNPIYLVTSLTNTLYFFYSSTDDEDSDSQSLHDLELSSEDESETFSSATQPREGYEETVKKKIVSTKNRERETLQWANK